MTTEANEPKGTAGARSRAREGPIDDTQQALALCGIAAPILLASVAIVLASLTPAYSHAANTVSELGEQGTPYALYFNVTMVVTGLLVVAFAVGLHRGIGAGRGSPTGPTLVAAFGLSAAVGSGVTPLGPDPVAPINLIHIVLVVLGFLGLAAGMYLVSVRMADDPAWTGYDRFTRWGSAVLLLLFGTWVLALFAVPLEVGEFPNGALQRPFVGWALIWIGLTATKLFALSRPAERPS